MISGADIKKALKNQAITLIVLFIVGVGLYVKDLIFNDTERKLEDKIEQVMIKQMQNPKMVQMFLSTKEIQNFVDDVVEDTKTKAAAEDSQHTKYRILLGIEMGVRDEVTHIEQGRLYKWFTIKKSFIDSMIIYRINNNQQGIPNRVVF